MPVGVCAGVCEGKEKNERLLGNKQGQHHDVQAQRRDVPESEVANVATFQRGYKTNVATFQRGYNPTSRRWDPTSRSSREAIIQRRNVGIQRRDVPKKGKTDVATLRRQRRDVES